MELPYDLVVGREVISELRLDDWVLEIKTYANRPDCQSVIGLAREVAALTQAPLRLPDVKIKGAAGGQTVPVYIEDFELCPRFCAQVIEDVTIGPSPGWLQAYLRLAGMRPINNVVDVTNFVMLEMGQPLHAYDLVLLRGPEIHVRRAKPGETIRTLDGIQRTLTGEMLVIADRDGAVGIAGVMGGESTEISPATRTIMLEAANFNAASVRRTSRTLGLPTEASCASKGTGPAPSGQSPGTGGAAHRRNRRRQTCSRDHGRIQRPAGRASDPRPAGTGKRRAGHRPARRRDEAAAECPALHGRTGRSESVEGHGAHVPLRHRARGRPDRGDRATVRLRPHRTDAAPFVRRSG